MYGRPLCRHTYVKFIYVGGQKGLPTAMPGLDDTINQGRA